MQKHSLDTLFNPKSIAVIGASNHKASVGRLVFENILKGRYAGKLFPINIKHSIILKQKAYASIIEITHPIDLAIITTPAQTVLEIIEQCGLKGVQSILIISAGFSEMGKAGQLLEKKILTLAQHYGIRIIGPNCLGLIRPSLNLNATFDNNNAINGSIAFVSQSGAIIAAVLDWAITKNIGFSTIVSLGNALDLDFGEILNFLALDRQTQSILMYIEGIHDATRFLNGLRAASKNKPVIIVKGGRHSQGIRAAHSHTGSLVGNDAVFDAAINMCGGVRVMSIEQLFAAANIFSSPMRTKGNQLAIITNGGGAGVLAADRAQELNIGLPTIHHKTLTQLNQVLPKTWSHQNPIDIIGDATPQRYHDTIAICAKDKSIDGLLIILTPIAITEPLKVARQIVADAKIMDKPILVCWMGGLHVQSSKKLFAKHHIPFFETPETAVEAFAYLADYQHHQQLLLGKPTPMMFHPKSDIHRATKIIKNALTENRHTLTTIESKAILNAFGINSTRTINVNSIQDAIQAVKSMQFPIVMKINSPDITHKQEVNGVRINVTDITMMKEVFNQMIIDAKNYQPDAQILGVTLEPMLQNTNNREIMIGMIRDNVFGPAITLGMGGSLVEIIHDYAVALPPLNPIIIQQLLEKTRLSKLLGPFRNKAAVNLEALIDLLLKVSEMICSLPFIQEMDINPIIVNDKEATVVDARIMLK